MIRLKRASPCATSLSARLPSRDLLGYILCSVLCRPKEYYVECEPLRKQQATNRNTTTTQRLSPVCAQTLLMSGYKTTNRKNSQCIASVRLHVYFTPDVRIMFYFNKILTAFYKRSVIVKTLHWLLWFLKVAWFNTCPEDGTGMPKHVVVAIWWLYLYEKIVHFVGKKKKYSN